jgi:hypothetical protein
MDWGPMLVKTVDLGYEQMLMIESHPGARLKVMYGGVWLTEEGILQDAWLGNGDEVALKSRGLALIEGLGPTRIQLLEDRNARGALGGVLRRGLQSVAARVRRALQALRTRLHLGAANVA